MISATGQMAIPGQAIEERNRAAKVFTLYRHKAYLQRMIEDLDKFPDADPIKQDYYRALGDIEKVKERLEAL